MAEASSDLIGYAAAVAPVIDRAHEEFHRKAAPLFALAMSGMDRDDPRRFFLAIRYAILARPMSREQIGLALRYHAPDRIDLALERLCDGGHLRHEAGRYVLTDRAREFLDAMYDVHADVAANVWRTPGIDRLADFTARLLDAATETAGPAFGAMAPPFERDGDPPGLLLFNRLAAFRYHRADAHAAAWSAEGLTVAEVVALGTGELRERIEQETNRRAAPPFGVLGASERVAYIGGLHALAGA